MKQNSEKNKLRALKAWETMRKRGYIKKKDKKRSYKNNLKNNQREIMIKLIKEYLKDFEEKNPLRQSKYMIEGIYLESPELLFTKMIEKEKLNHEIFFKIPNNLEYKKFNIGQNGFNIHNQAFILYEPHIPGSYWKNISNIVLVRDSYKDIIQDIGSDFTNIKNHKWNYVFIWADYCGAFSSFYEDIELTFSKKILGNNSIFAVTFCIRDMAKKKKLPFYSKTNCIVALNDFVTKSAKKYGYTTEILPESGNYKQNMYTCIFKIIHPQLTKDAEKIIELQKTHNLLVSELEYKINKIKNEYE